MTIKEFIEKAIEGGWKYNDYCDGKGCEDRHIFLDPLAWQAVGKVHWGDGALQMNSKYGFRLYVWKDQMHRMIDALAEGKTLEEFISTIK